MFGAGTAPGGRPLGSYQFGATGVTGGGYINWQDASNALVNLYRQKVAASEQAWRNGLITNPNEMQSLRDSLKRWEDIQANRGVTPQIFALPEYSTDNFFTEANEASRLPGMGGQVRQDAVEAVLPASLRGQNQGQLMHPWTATGLVDSNFGSGSEGNYVAGGIARNRSTTAPSDPNRASAFSNPFNGGQPMGTGSYLGGPGGVIPYGQPFGSTGTARGYNSFGPGGSFSGYGTTGNRGTNTEMRQREPGNYSPYQRNQPDRMLDMYRYNSPSNWQQTSGAMAAPFAGPTTVDYRQSPDFSARYMGPYSPAFYNNAMNSAAIYGGLLGSDRSPYSYQSAGQGIFGNEFSRRGF